MISMAIYSLLLTFINERISSCQNSAICIHTACCIYINTIIVFILFLFLFLTFTPTNYTQHSFYKRRYNFNQYRLLLFFFRHDSFCLNIDLLVLLRTCVSIVPIRWAFCSKIKCIINAFHVYTFTEIDKVIGARKSISISVVAAL